MSVRAHRVDKLEYKKGMSFNLRNDEDLIAFFCEQDPGNAQQLDEGAGMIDISVETIAKALTEVKNLEPCVREALEEDLAWAKKEEREYILYDCF